MLIGKRIYGRYKIVEMIGGGGMANVYLAKDMILEREVAIKILRMDFNNDEEFIKRFNREAQSATSLAHPNIVSIYDVGEENDIYFIVMEYVKGYTLKQYIQQHHHIPIEKSMSIMEQITSAIEHAHQHGIIHRDIKPQNILIDENGHVKITDFGIATALSATTITQTNAVLGSVHYLSPEQARGGMANKKSDIYSLGIVMFELLTGRLPFSGESAVSIALKHLQSSTPSLKRWNPNIPQSVENIVLKATAKDPFNRYDSVRQMKEDIATALQPNRTGEKPYVIPNDIDATKAMPIITDTTISGQEETIILNGHTQVFAEKEKAPVKEKEVKTKAVKGTKKKKQKKSKQKKPKRKRTKIWAGIIVLLVILGVAAAMLLPDFLASSDVEVPDVQGKELNEAQNELITNGFLIGEIIEVTDEDIEENNVVRTNPKAGKMVANGSEIDLYVSTGKKKVEVENFVERTYSDPVKNAIISQGFQEPKLEYEYNEDLPEGTIIRQSPDAGEQVAPSETEFVLTISQGPDKIRLKDLEGYNKKSLDDYENETGLNIVTKEVYTDSDEDKGLVISQSPAAYTMVSKGTTVTVQISLGQKELPPKTVNLEVDIPYEPEVEGQPQVIEIMIEDEYHEIIVPADTFSITENTKRTITLTIAPNQKASYQIIRDNKVIDSQKVPYPTDD
ncbi:MAG: Stk1 family PASTA domain-containing Ser/Thr kinase [Bacillus sp. (in: firmicutes)]